MRTEFAIPIVAYLLGAIPFGFILVRVFQKSDIRQTGSGNIGATNVYRKSKWAGILTLLLDGGKGYLAVMIAAWLGGDRDWQAAAALLAILGHVFTVFLGFKGGKGVATGCGAFLAVSPPAVGCALIVFVLTVALSRYISLASILGTAAFPLCAVAFHEPLSVVIWAAMGGAVIIIKHHSNIRRLIAGTENRFALRGGS
jgi:acyl phosphate:glycerol-3-phosphate acyltransferase